MIRFLLTRDGKATIRRLQAIWGRESGVAFDLRVYCLTDYGMGGEAQSSRRRLGRAMRTARSALARARMSGWPGEPRPRAFVFTDIERLSPRERESARLFYEELAAEGDLRLLNHPGHVHCRYELLRRLHDEGWNDFNVYRVSELAMPRRYPVFLRNEADHRGPTSGLLPDEPALRAELQRRENAGLLRDGEIIVEFCDTRAGDGLTHKYGAYRVGRRIIPRHLFVGRDWVLKSSSRDPAARDIQAEIESEYVRENPHEAELLRIFELAGIDYGRIDYAIRDGRIQTWEINTNPTLLDHDHFGDAERSEIVGLFLKRFGEALLEIEGSESS